MDLNPRMYLIKGDGLLRQAFQVPNTQKCCYLRSWQAGAQSKEGRREATKRTDPHPKSAKTENCCRFNNTMVFKTARFILLPNTS
jgi:hypothetical protein